jgi:hypothetical protein
MAVRQERSALTIAPQMHPLTMHPLTMHQLTMHQRPTRQPTSPQEMTVAAIEDSSAQHDGFRIWIS